MITHKLLLLDDEENILRACNRILRREGYEIRTTTSPEEGLKLLKEETFSVVLSDFRMPVMPGTQFLEEAKQVSPKTVRILFSGMDEIHSMRETLDRISVFQLIKKPWKDDDLRSVIRQAVNEFERNEGSKTEPPPVPGKEPEALPQGVVSYRPPPLPDGSPVQSPKILIVDDQRNMALAILRMIRNHLGYKDLVISSNAMEAWKRLKSDTFHLIIADWNMPQKSGYELLCEVREDEEIGHTPFLIVTGSSDRKNILKALQAGVNAYIVKPFDAKTLIEKIQKVFVKPNKFQ